MRIQIWSFKTGECLNTLLGHSDYVLCLQVITNEILSSGGSDNLIKIWNMKTGKCVNTCYGHSGSINVLQMASNLISASNDKTIKIWNYKNGQCIFTLKDHWNEIKCLKCIDKDTLASGSVDHFIKLWSKYFSKISQNYFS